MKHTAVQLQLVAHEIKWFYQEIQQGKEWSYKP